MSILSPAPAAELLPIPRVQRQGIELSQHLYATLNPQGHDCYTLILEVADLKHRLHDRSGPCEALVTVSFCSGPVEPVAAKPESGTYHGGRHPLSLCLDAASPDVITYPFALPDHEVTMEMRPSQVQWRLTWNQKPHDDWAGFMLRSVSPDGTIPKLGDFRWAFRDRVNLGVSFRVRRGRRVGATTRAVVEWFGPDCGPSLRDRGQVEGAFFYEGERLLPTP